MGLLDFAQQLLGVNFKKYEPYFTITNLETGTEFTFQFNPELAMDVYNNIAYHQGVMGDNPIPLPAQGGARNYRVTTLLYKINGSDVISTDYNLIAAMAKKKDGVLPLLEMILPCSQSTKCYCSSLTFKHWPDFVAPVSKDEPRKIEVEMMFTKYFPLPTPTLSNVAPADGSFYSEADTDSSGDSKGKTGTKDKDVLGGILNGTGGGESPGGADMDGLGD